MTFIGFTDGIKGWKFMRSKNTIFHATKAVFDESTFLHCPEGNRVSILAIETGLLNIDEPSPPEENDQVPPQDPPPPLVESDPIWHPSGPHAPMPCGGGGRTDPS